jgi:dienelactone hydrolase
MKTLLTLCAAALTALSLSVSSFASTKPWPENHGRVATRLFVTPDDSPLAADAPKRPLIVAMGGAEGGNAWAGPRAQVMRNAFLSDGYALLALGYFGAPGTPEKLDRIALEGVRNAIAEAAKHPQVDARCIALVGGSKGAELALLLASRDPSIKAVAAIVPGSVVFVGHTDQFDTGSFSENKIEIPYVPMTQKAVPSLLAGNKRKVFDLMMEDTDAVARARIPVEKINGPIFFLSATQDELWASREMSDQMMQSLKQANFRHAHEHVAIEGSHAAPMRHLNLVRKFLNEQFLTQAKQGCAR